MDNAQANVSADVQAADVEQNRIVWEMAGIAKARASVEAGRLVSSEAVDAWIDSVDTDHELPPPRPGQ